MTIKEITLDNARIFFERRAIDNQGLTSIIPELLDVIGQLYDIRKSESATRSFIEIWRKTKFTHSKLIQLNDGTTVEAEINPDMKAHDFFTGYLFQYFYKLYEQKTGKTIGFAFALEILTQIKNSKKAIYNYELPNTDIDDVFDAIDEEHLKLENSNTLALKSITNENQFKAKPEVVESQNFIDYLHHENKEALMAKLHELLDHAKGKNVAITIKALKELGYLAGMESKNTLYELMRIEFGDIGANSGLNNFLNDNNKLLTEDQLNPIIVVLKSI